MSEHETLDPQDWGHMRALAHRMVDDAFSYLEGVRDRPAWQHIPDEVAQNLKEPLPLEPQGAEKAYQDFCDNVMPYPMGNIHPRFWAWYMGSGTVMGALGDFLAAIMNPNLGGGNHAAAQVELQVIDWCKAMLGFPADASGLIVSGASMANLVGLAVARHAQAGFDIRRQGQHAAPKPLVFYSSVEVHSCHQKSAELMGLGSNALRKIPTRANYRIDVDALEHAIAKDRAEGFQPFCVIGSAGTINTGAVDDLNALADLCEQEKFWFHVDGAIGAVAAIAPKLRHLVAGIERADSIALDLHKSMHVPFEAGVVLVKHADTHFRTFALSPEYLQTQTRGLASGRWLYEYGVQTTRGFKALKVWLSFKEHGINRYARILEKNVEQARYLAQLIEKEERLELMAPVGMDIVCFRFNPGGLTDEALDTINKELLIRIHESGVAVPSYTTLDGKYCLRVAISNHRSTFEDFDIFIEAVLEQGGRLLAEGFAEAGAFWA
jgi:aromatic-L-amino-acid decarboxylase